MFIEVNSLNLLEGFFQQSRLIALVNTYGVTIFHSFFFNAVAFFLYSSVLSTLYQKKPNYFKYALASVIYCLMAQGPVFLVSYLRLPFTQFHIEDLFVAPPPYFVPIMYLLCTYFLQIDKTISLATSNKLYVVIVANVIVYYMLEAWFFFLMTNNPMYQMVIYLCANIVLCAINVVLSVVVIRYIKRRKLWMDVYKIKKASKGGVGRALAIYTGLFTMLWLIIVPILKIVSYLDSILVVSTATVGLLLVCGLVLTISYMRDALRVRLVDLNNQTSHVHSLIGSIDNIRTLKHDMKNMLSVYDGYIQMEEWDKLAKYHGALRQETKYAEDLLDINMKHAMDPIVRTLLTTKISDAKAKGIYVDVTISADTGDIAMEALDLARMLGILLDNAIEETELTKTKSILFSLQTMKNGKILLSISNPTVGQVNLKEITAKGCTTKPGHTGLGLFTLWNIVQRTPACRMSAECLENVITFYLELPAQVV